MKHIKMFEEYTSEKYEALEEKKKAEKEEGKEEKAEDKKDGEEEKKDDEEEEKAPEYFFEEKDLEKDAEALTAMGDKKVGPEEAGRQLEEYLEKNKGAMPPSQKKAVKGAISALKEIVKANIDKGRKV